ncbi:hypothetical protein [Anaerofustis sp.]|uniref:hypothetical protein n=1 Tax=Anaerofustis sp. TaxID=1872517 RepID=UPI0025C0DACD|nr:hypothetical protein [Anaerofustis sp.]
MARRNLLHKTKLEEFKKFLILNGWEIQPVKGEWEILRAKNKNEKYPLIVYKRYDVKEHYTLMNRDIYLFYEFKKYERKQGA